jgi:hypothetical protein
MEALEGLRGVDAGGDVVMVVAVLLTIQLPLFWMGMGFWVEYRQLYPVYLFSI